MMALPLSPSLCLILIFFLSICSPSSHVAARPPPNERTTNARDHPQDAQPPANKSLILTSCAGAQYPSLCVHILSSSQFPTATPNDLSRATVSASLSFCRNTTDFLSKAIVGVDSDKFAMVIKDCKQQLGNSADLLTRALSELNQLKPETSKWQLENAMTRVSAALTNGQTCLDGLRGAKAPPGVTRRVSAVSWVTSNALYLIHRMSLAAKKRGGH